MRTFSLVALLGALFLLTGCRGEPIATPEAAPAPSPAEERIAATLAKLPPEDQEAARAQKMCPVGEMPLGSMGVPPKVDVNGRDVFICCEGCRDELLSDPEKYLAKIDS